MTLIPAKKTRYISFTKYVEGTEINLRFIDSFHFMGCALEELASYLEKYDIVESLFNSDYTADQIKLLTKRGVFPCDYISCLAKLAEAKLPAQEKFHSSLNDSDISNEAYEHAKAVWSKFDVQSLGEYSDLHLKTDVLLSADVFENFRDNCLATYGLDLAYYYTTPGFSWNAMLKYTKVERELLTDIDVLLFVRSQYTFFTMT